LVASNLTRATHLGGSFSICIENSLFYIEKYIVVRGKENIIKTKKGVSQYVFDRPKKTAVQGESS
jgi:hypothetical protein